MKNTSFPYSLSLLSTLSLVSLLLLGPVTSAWSQQVFRCAGVGGAAPEYINNVRDAQSRNCQPVSGGNVTVVQGTPVPKAPVRATATSPAAGNARVDSSPGQQARDSDSRIILESELRKSEARLAELEKEYKNGEPDKQGIEGRNYQRYLDRVSDMKDSIARSQSDIAGLKREISRLPASN